MKVSVSRSGAKLGVLDYALTTVGSMLAVYSAGMSIETPMIGYFCAALIVFGMVFSYAVRTLIGGMKIVKIDGILYALAAMSAILFAPSLSTLMPENGFPLQMAAAGGLCWMLIFGSFLSWRDGTLLFQAVPGIAVFGLVGCYDTYKNVVFAFFGFLICLCTGFARAHGREMLRLAADSGYFDRAGIKFDPGEPEQSAELFDAVRKGPWRWVAGPEWALASALAIVLISLLGAPVIQSSVQGVAGFAAIKMPPSRHRQNGQVTPGPDSSGSTAVGQGPITGMTGQPVFEAKLDHARYLRMHTYVDYTGLGWRSDTSHGVDGAQKLLEMSIDEIVDPKVFSFQIIPRMATRSFALPGDVDLTSFADSRVSVAPDGGYEGSVPVDAGQVLSGRSIESGKPGVSRSAPNPLPEILEAYAVATNATPAVTEFVTRVTAKCPDDRAKADALIYAIGNQAQYNANAPVTPAGRDPVEYFLFDSHQGYCDLFASAMVLGARSVGIPARYVTGYLPDENSSLGGTYVVKDRDYHAWAELYFKNTGWVIYDPTTLAKMAPGGELKNNDGSNSILTATLGRILDLGIAVLVLGAVVLFVRAKWRPRDATGERRGELEQAYVAFARSVRSATGRRRLLSETPSEYLKATLPSLNGASSKAEELTSKFERALYSPCETSSETVTELRSDLKEFKQLLRAERKAPKSGARVRETEKSASQ